MSKLFTKQNILKYLQKLSNTLLVTSNKISKLFRDRQLGVKKLQNKKRREAAKTIQPISVVPKHRPKETIGKHISRFHTEIYRPPTSPTQISTRKNPKAKTGSGYTPKYLAGSSKKNKSSPYLPVPKDSNYRQCNTGPQVLKFVNCELCGKQGFSGRKQLFIHQTSKKCENRQLHKIVHKCHICYREFDTPHNLNWHTCRK